MAERVPEFSPRSVLGHRQAPAFVFRVCSCQREQQRRDAYSCLVSSIFSTSPPALGRSGEMSLSPEDVCACFPWFPSCAEFKRREEALPPPVGGPASRMGSGPPRGLRGGDISLSASAFFLGGEISLPASALLLGGDMSLPASVLLLGGEMSLSTSALLGGEMFLSASALLGGETPLSASALLLGGDMSLSASALLLGGEMSISASALPLGREMSLLPGS